MTARVVRTREGDMDMEEARVICTNRTIEDIWTVNSVSEYG